MNYASTMHYAVALLCVLTNTYLIGTSSGNSMHNALYELLMQGYEKQVRPTAHHTIATNVTFGFLLHSVIDLDEISQILTTRAWLNINWLDPRLTWNSSNFNGIKILQIPFDKLWKPDVIVMNNAVQAFESAMMSTDIFVTPDGNVTWLSAAIFRSTCTILMHKFPFDDQQCMINFTSWTHTSNEIDLLLITENGDLSSYKKSSEFHLKSMKLLPGFVISSMSLIGFLIPAESGEKVTMYTTTMLSMGVYLKAITKIVPASTELSVVGIYFVGSLFLVCVTTTFNIWNMNIHSYSSVYPRPVPKWIKRFILGHMAKLLRVKLVPLHLATKMAQAFTSDDSTDSDSSEINVNGSAEENEVFQSGSRCMYPTAQRNDRATCSRMTTNRLIHESPEFQTAMNDIECAMRDVLVAVSDHISKYETKLETKDRDEMIVNEWKILAFVLDRFLLCVFILVTTIVTLVMFLSPPKGQVINDSN